MELVVLAPSGPIRRCPLATFLQSRRTRLDRHAVLLLVPAPLGDRRRRAHRNEPSVMLFTSPPPNRLHDWLQG